MAPVKTLPTGTVNAGGLPVSGAAIQLWQVGTGGDAAPALSMLSGAMTTSDGSGAVNSNANPGNLKNTVPAGAFTIAGAYHCPTPSTPVYLTAVGGNPGPGKGANPQLALMTYLGTCGSVGTGGTIVVNEVTSVATIAALGNYMTISGSFGALGFNTITTNANIRKAFPDDSAVFAQNALKVPQYADIHTGLAPGPALHSGYAASTTTLLSLANSLSACARSSGGVAGDGSPCGQLFTDASFPGQSIPADTIAAAIAIVQNPNQLLLQTPNYSINTTCSIWALGNATPVFAGGAASCAAATFTWKMPIAPLVAPPVIVAMPGPAQPGVPLYITDSTSGATIVYTTDGSTPTATHGATCAPSAIKTATPVPCLTPNAAESVRAIAIDGAGNPSSVVSQAIARAGAPAPVAGLIASAAGNGVSLVWNTSAGASSYSIYRYTLSPGVPVSTVASSFAPGLAKIHTVTAPTTEYLDTSAAPGIDYLYVVTAGNNAGESAFSTHSCSSPSTGGTNLPAVRPRIFMAAHGTNLTDDAADTYYAFDGPGALINQPASAWAFVATCLDGIWGNWSQLDSVDEQALFNSVNTRSLITEYDVIASLGNATPVLWAATDARLVGPQQSALGPIVLSREGMSLYKGGAGLWQTYQSVLSVANAHALYQSSSTAPAWSQSENIFWGTDITQWNTPAVVPAAGVHGGALSIPQSIAAINGLQGSFIEGGLASPPIYRQQSVNAIDAAHARGKRFIAFYSLPGNLDKLGVQSSYWLSQIQQDYSFAVHTSCNGVYDPVTGNYYPAGGLYNPTNNTYVTYPASVLAGLQPYSTCPNGAATGMGLWQREDIVMIINYLGYYPSVPEYATPPQPGTEGVYSDSVTGILNWLLHQ